MRKILALLVMMTGLLGCMSRQQFIEAAPAQKWMTVNGSHLYYLDQGQGIPVIFVHGGISDHRSWHSQRAALSPRYRFIAIDQRYFGTAPWSDEGEQFSAQTHSADLAAFIHGLDAGPVYLVGQSYGSVIALAVAARQPALVRAVFINEPPLPDLVSDVAGQDILKKERKGLANIATALQDGDTVRAARLFVDWVQGQDGAFAALPPAMQTMHLDNARTLPLQFKAAAGLKLGCPELSAMQVPVSMTMGVKTRPFFRTITQAAQHCMPDAELIIIPQARHAAPWQNAAAYNEALLAFLARH